MKTKLNKTSEGWDFLMKEQLQNAINLLNQKEQYINSLKIRVFDAEEQIKTNESHIQHFLNEIGKLLNKEVTLQDVYDFIAATTTPKDSCDREMENSETVENEVISDKE